MTAFDTAVQKVLTVEGGYSNDLADRGGETNYGITVTTARTNGYWGPMKDLPIETAKQIYKREYWDALNLDHIAVHSPEIAEELFDSAVNCGIRTAGKWLQTAINALTLNAITVDGSIGYQTLEAFRNLAAIVPSKASADLLKILNILQGAHYLNIVQRDEKQKRFIRGWLKRVTIK